MRGAEPEAAAEDAAALSGGGRPIVRDTSSSMEGLWHRWAGLVCTSVVDLAKQHRMPVRPAHGNTPAQP